MKHATAHSSHLAAIALASLALVACSEEPASPPAADPGSLRELAQGQVVGYVGQYGSHVWRGLPFAAPPVGPLRWRAPAPPVSWEGTREALAQGSFCPQHASPLGGVPGEAGEVLGSEDCLFLDIYAPRATASDVPKGDARLPVMVWIHGGSNLIGHAGLYDGGRLAQSQDVVVVAINYRLGPFGWFRHASLREGASAADGSGNFGTLDMIAALRWVRANAAAFGGDPGSVTIFGESAGGTDVVSLLVSPLARGLFHRAIVQSGSTYMRTPAEAEHFTDDTEPGAVGSSNEVLLAMLQRDGKANDRASARQVLSGMSGPEIARYLRSQSPPDLLAIYTREETEGLIDQPRVFRDGAVIPPEHANERFANGSWNVVPVVLGTNRDENKLFMYGDERWITRWFDLVPRFEDEEGFQVRAQYGSLMWKATGVDEPAAAIRRSSPDVWAYRFDWDEEPTLMGADLSSMLGAAHGFEIPFVFGHYDLGQAGSVLFDDDNLPGREELAAKMMSYWTQFARTGNPGRGHDGSLPAWERWSNEPGAPRFVLLDTEAGGGIRMSTESVTQQSVVAAAAADPRVVNAPDRCEILSAVADWSDATLPGDCAEATPGAVATAAAE